MTKDAQKIHVSQELLVHHKPSSTLIPATLYRKMLTSDCTGVAHVRKDLTVMVKRARHTYEVSIHSA